MSKNIYEMLNDVDIDLEELKNDEFDDIDKAKTRKRIMKKINKNKNYRKYIAIASILIISLCLLNKDFVSYAKEIIEDLGYKLSKALYLPYNLDDYTEVINKSITRNGIELTLNDVVLNSEEINFTYTIKSDKKLEEVGYDDILIKGISINGEDVSVIGGSGSDLIDEYTAETVTTAALLGIDENELKGDVDIKIEWDIWRDGESKGRPWVFKFKANGKQLALDTEEIEINKTIELESGAKINFEKFTRNKMGETFYATIDNYDYEKYYDIKIKGIDKNGLEVVFTMGNCSAETPRLKRFYTGDDLDLESMKFTVYVAEVETGYMAFDSDFKKVSDEFKVDE
ncbi:MAG: DUF4179 domain-containing protein [Peptostreptococcaceae bacterium]